MNIHVKNIVETVKAFSWRVNKMWIRDNCIYAIVTKPSGRIEEEGFYAGAEDDKQDVQNVYIELEKTLKEENLMK